MRWPWQSTADVKAKTIEVSDQAIKATGEIAAAQREYEETVRHGRFLHEVVSVVFYHAEQNDIVEKFQRVVRGH